MKTNLITVCVRLAVRLSNDVLAVVTQQSYRHGNGRYGHLNRELRLGLYLRGNDGRHSYSTSERRVALHWHSNDRCDHLVCNW